MDGAKLSMKISIRRIGTAGREMVGVHRSSERPGSLRPAFLMCRPLGQEAIRTSAMYRALAERLARDGCDSLCFDYHGTGDSPGGERMQSLALWMQDTLTAHEDLLQASPNRPVHWFGMALGANIALRAAARASVAPAKMVLWEPVIDGDRYVQALLESHRQELARELGFAWHQIVERKMEREPVLPGEVLGFDFGEMLISEIKTFSKLDLSPAIRRGVNLTCGVLEAQMTNVLPAPQGNANVFAIKDVTNWMSTEALGTALVPQDLTRALLSTVQ
jgi:pimeloyl-ACP methyl ester carboxylesterase